MRPKDNSLDKLQKERKPKRGDEIEYLDFSSVGDRFLVSQTDSSKDNKKNNQNKLNKNFTKNKTKASASKSYLILANKNGAAHRFCDLESNSEYE